MAINKPDNKLKLLLGSGGFSGVPGGRQYLAKEMQTFFKNVKNIIFIGYAVSDPKEGLNIIEEHKVLPDHNVKSVTDFEDQPKSIMEADGVIVFGGNTFRLLSKLYEHRLLEPIRKRAFAGMPYMGSSAGTNVATPTIRTTNDMPIMSPPKMEALNLVGFQINPHYVRGVFFSQEGDKFIKYAGETRDDRIREFHEENTTDVVGIPEASFIKVLDGRVWYESPTESCARFFRKDQPSKDLAPGSDLFT